MFTVTLELLFVVTGSCVSDVPEAVLITVPAVEAVATICKVAVAPLFSVPMVHRPVVWLYVPCAVALVTYVRPWGRRSVTRAFWAADGPLLVTTMVNVTLLPTVGVVVEAIFVTARSAVVTTAPMVTVTLDVLLAVLGSVTSDVPEAVLMTVPAVEAVATICKVAVAPLFSVPMVHRPVF